MDAFSYSQDAATRAAQIAAVRLYSQQVRDRAARMRAQSRAVQSRLGENSASFDPRLSLRERQALRLLATGLATKEIAARMAISVNTANYHLANVYRKLGTHGRVAAANAYARMVRPETILPPGD